MIQYQPSKKTVLKVTPDCRLAIISIRRQFLVGYPVPNFLLAGYTAHGENTVRIPELEAELVNGTNSSPTFRSAIEITYWITNWGSQNVAPSSREYLVKEPPSDSKPVSDSRVVEDEPTSSNFSGIDDESGE